jgi:lactate dehydrogenase-like 2-hydroxyacid dehydrogenase
MQMYKGSDHVDLTAANEKKILVAEVTGSNVVSVAEHGYPHPNWMILTNM